MKNWKCKLACKLTRKLARKLSCNYGLNRKSVRFLRSLSEVMKCLNSKK